VEILRQRVFDGMLGWFQTTIVWWNNTTIHVWAFYWSRSICFLGFSLKQTNSFWGFSLEQINRFLGFSLAKISGFLQPRYLRWRPTIASKKTLWNPGNMLCFASISAPHVKPTASMHQYNDGMWDPNSTYKYLLTFKNAQWSYIQIMFSRHSWQQMP